MTKDSLHLSRMWRILELMGEVPEEAPVRIPELVSEVLRIAEDKEFAEWLRRRLHNAQVAYVSAPDPSSRRELLIELIAVRYCCSTSAKMFRMMEAMRAGKVPADQILHIDV